MTRSCAIGWRLVAMVAAAAVPLALTATNAVPASAAGTHQQATGINDTKPAGGDDCIVGGGGGDTIDGGLGTDVCIGGPGLDTFTNCETTIQDALL